MCESDPSDDACESCIVDYAAIQDATVACLCAFDRAATAAKVKRRMPAMSLLDYLPAVRIWWNGRRGVACSTSGRRDLRDKPDLGFRFVEVDYAPGVCCQIRREAWHPLDDMRAEEAEACARYLYTLAATGPEASHTEPAR